jgi:hypothetical protein
MGPGPPEASGGAAWKVLQERGRPGMAETDFEKAEKLTARRARMATVLGVVFITTQAATLRTDGELSRPEMITLKAWVVWAVAMLVLLMTGGGLLRGARVRALMNDESTRANRLQAIATGFWIAIVTALVIYVATFWEVVDARQAARIIVTTALGGAMIRFGMLERRSLRDGQ